MVIMNEAFQRAMNGGRTMREEVTGFGGGNKLLSILHAANNFFMQMGGKGIDRTCKCEVCTDGRALGTTHGIATWDLHNTMDIRMPLGNNEFCAIRIDNKGASICNKAAPNKATPIAVHEVEATVRNNVRGCNAEIEVSVIVQGGYGRNGLLVPGVDENVTYISFIFRG